MNNFMKLSIRFNFSDFAWKIIVFCWVSLMSQGLFAIDPLEFDEVLFSHVQNTSKIEYKKYIEENPAISISKEWKECLDSVFKKLIHSSGNKYFQPEYSVIDKQSLNAFAFPGGQFIFHKGLFTQLDAEIKTQENPKDATTWKKMRENYLAPIIGHELAHYYNNHSFKAFKNLFSSSQKGSSKNLELLRFDQELELDADFTGLLLIQKSGYNPSYFVKILKLLNASYQKDLKSGEKINPYFETHPSPNERLSKIDSNQKELFQLLSSLEKAYADIQMNQKLEQAFRVIEKALNEYPDSLEFLKAQAVAKHKIWLTTVPIADQKMKSIVELPSFRDELLANPETKKAITKKIPGDINKFQEAIKAYRKIEDPSDPWLLSNFATLIAYSEKKSDEESAIQMAKKAFQLQKNIQTINNLAVVLYLCNKPEQAIGILSTMANYIHPELKSIPSSQNQEGILFAKEWKKEIAKSKQKIDDLEEDLGAILLNLALTDENLSKKLATEYYNSYDNESVWAKYLSNFSGVSIVNTKASSTNISVDGLGAGDSIKDLVDKWGKPSRPPQAEDEFEAWYYDEKNVKVSLHQGKIVEILLSEESSPPLSNSLKIGNTKEEVDSILGKGKKKGNKYVYEKKGKIVAAFDDGVVDRLYLYNP